MTARIVGIVLVAGCGSASGTFKFDRLHDPASMSAFVDGPDGGTVDRNDLHVVGRAEVEERFWGIVYGFVDITGDVDIGDRLNAQIKAKGGEALINLTATAAHCGMNNVFGFNWLPIWPGCVNGKVEGEIVRYVPRTGTAARPVPVRVVRPDEVGVTAAQLLARRVGALVAAAAQPMPPDGVP
jgi:hypothetical protein